jgi:hypothetical protein
MGALMSSKEGDARGMMAHVQVIATLATMAEVYRLPREGGAACPRFKRYLELIPSNYALVAYNPMAGPHALETTEQLLAVNAEGVAMEAASEAANLCGYPDTITLAVVLCAPGGWTDRLVTEIEHRTAHRLPPGVQNASGGAARPRRLFSDTPAAVVYENSAVRHGDI